MNKYISTKTSLLLSIDNNPYVVQTDHCNYDTIKRKVISGDYDVVDLIDVIGSIKKYTANEVTIDDGCVRFNGSLLQTNITNRICEMIKHGDDYTHLHNFLKRCACNPDPDILEQLDMFLNNVNIPIGLDGSLYAYKAIRSDYMDKHSGTCRNKVGDVVKMDRDNVATDRDVGCSGGLHFGSIEYVRTFASTGDLLVIVKVDPADIVCVPKDHNHQKVRCCKYIVTSEVSWDYLLNTRVQTNVNGDDVISTITEEDSTTTTPTLTPKVGSKWESSEDDLLREFRFDGESYNHISSVLLRSANACRKRAKRLGIL